MDRQYGETVKAVGRIVWVFDMNLKRKFNFIIFLVLCFGTLVSCDHNEVENVPANTPDVSGVEDTLSETPEIVENSSLPSQASEKLKDGNHSEKINAIYGKWKILNMVGEGYIYGDFSVEDYVGGIITIRENYIETNLPLGRWKLNNPIYKFKKQNEDDFWEYRHANLHNGFGFKSEQIKSVTVFDDNDEWDEFGGYFYIRDKEHLIFLGPVYFLAEKVK